ncbi:MAG: ATP-binding protein [Clostridia bacterium]|jgi:predicted ATP-dependent endonuclease of OLD family|nr:ATP-binding protein [Clostridia bacterium]
MKIIIKEIELTNFRNIEHKIYKFNDWRNAICGKNAIGKSNVLQAIMWLFTSKLLNGSPNDADNKPIGKSDIVVSVKATIQIADEFHTIEKQYAEIIKDEKLIGHTTSYIIDRIAYKTIKDAEERLNSMLGINDRLIAMNPLFIDILDYKVLRKLIIELIGDIKPEMILSNNKFISETLTSFKSFAYDVDAYAKYLSGEIKRAKDDIKTTKTLIAFLDNDTDIKSMRFGIAECDKRLIGKVLSMKKQMSDSQDKIATFETEQAALEKYAEIRLKMLNNNAKAIFQKIKWVLIESNIKEGSYQEVCYPLIVGKSTKFEKGSTSEKVITGIAIIEAIKEATNGNDLPIVFDEGEAFDSESLESKLNTNSQIITAKVNDEFDAPQVKEFK